MTLVVLVILAALWAVVLLPPLLRSRSERSNDSIGDFNYRLDALGRTNGALRMGAMRGNPGQRAAKRRRDVTVCLVALLGLTAVSALATNAVIAWVAFVVTALAFATFLGLWAFARSLQAERAQKVRPLPKRPPEYRLRRAASS